MSDIVWCDMGGHMMSADDPDREFWSVKVNQDRNDQRMRRIDVCGKHKAPTISFPQLPAMVDQQKEIGAPE